jgi:hypothetical protein
VQSRKTGDCRNKVLLTPDLRTGFLLFQQAGKELYSTWIKLLFQDRLLIKAKQETDEYRFK